MKKEKESQFRKCSTWLFFSLSCSKAKLGGGDYLHTVLLCNSLCKQFWWNKLTLRCSLTLPAAWEMITERYWAKQPLAMPRLYDILYLSLCVTERETVLCVCWQDLIERRTSIFRYCGLCNCHHNSLILFLEGINMIQGWKKCSSRRE